MARRVESGLWRHCRRGSRCWLAVAARRPRTRAAVATTTAVARSPPRTGVLDPNAKGPAPEVPGAKKGGTITIDSQSTPNTLDPTTSYYTDSHEIGKLIFRTPDPVRGPRTASRSLVPDLTDLGTVSADGLTWTFKMQPGIKYEDGTPSQGRRPRVRDQALASRTTCYPHGPTVPADLLQGRRQVQGPVRRRRRPTPAWRPRAPTP